MLFQLHYMNNTCCITVLVFWKCIIKAEEMHLISDPPIIYLLAYLCAILLQLFSLVNLLCINYAWVIYYKSQVYVMHRFQSLWPLLTTRVQHRSIYRTHTNRPRPFKVIGINHFSGRDDLIDLFLTGKITEFQWLSVNHLIRRGLDQPRKCSWRPFRFIC